MQQEKYKSAFDAIQSMANQSSTAVDSYTTKKTELESVAQTGRNLAGIAERRLLWAELMKAINECLPRDAGEPPKEIGKRNQIHITRIDEEFYPDLTVWFSDVGAEWQKHAPKKNGATRTAPPTTEAAAAAAAAPGEPATAPESTAAPGDPASAPGNTAAPENGTAPADAPPGTSTDTAASPPAAATEAAATTDGAATTDVNAAADPNAVAADPNAVADPAADSAALDPAAAGETPVGPTGEGVVIELEGHHYHNDTWNQGAVFVRDTLIKNLETKTVMLPVYDDQGRPTMHPFTMKELGVDYPVITYGSKLIDIELGESGQVNTSNSSYGGTTATPATATGVKPVKVKKYDFRVQICWKPRPASQRLESEQTLKQPNGLAATSQGEQEAVP